MLARRVGMAFETLMTMATYIHSDSAWEFYKFIMSIGTGFLISMLFWFLSVEESYVNFSLFLMLSFACGILFARNEKKDVDVDGSVTSQGYSIMKRRSRRDDDDSMTVHEIADETAERTTSSLKDLPVALEPPRKNCRRQKKKRNSMKSNKSKYKCTMDDSSETSSNNDSYPKIVTQSEKTKVYSPLPEYLKLNLELYAMYNEFKPYILTLDQLQRYGFPREAPDHPGRITPDPNLKKGSTRRICCRCNKGFYILAGGQYKADSCCRYHPKKPLQYRKDHGYSGEFPCCKGNFMSEGCTTWQYHVSAESFLHEVDFVKARSKRHLNEVTACTLYALDCEMLYTTAGMEVAKVGIVGVDGLTVFESYVLPQNQVLDYNTHYSGVSEKDLKNVTTTLIDVQTFLLKLLNKDSILVGHGLENDLKALRLIHEKVVDTSVVFPHPHSKIHRKSLKVLAKECLNKHIQQSVNGHDCIEDARTCMEIMLCKISSDLEKRLPVADENKNTIIPPMQQPQPPAPVISVFPYTCNYSYYTDSFGENYYSGFLLPNKYYQKSCIY